MADRTKAMRNTGWVLTGATSLLLTVSGVAKLVRPEGFEDQWVGLFGWPAERALAIGIVELACLAVFLFPRTAILGAILLTGYLGGATATHVRVGDPFVVPVIVGVVVWLALILREPRLRALLPFRATATHAG